MGEAVREKKTSSRSNLQCERVHSTFAIQTYLRFRQEGQLVGTAIIKIVHRSNMVRYVK